MANFGFIEKQAIRGDSNARYRLFGLRINGGVPFLDMRPASEENADYHKASIRSDVQAQKRIEAMTRGQRQAKRDEEAILEDTLTAWQRQRERDLPLFAAHVVTGWGIEYTDVEAIERRWKGFKPPRAKLGEALPPVEGPMLDGDGAAVECTPENVEDFLRAVAKRSAQDWDLVRTWAKTPSNFRDTMDAETLAKNSESDSSGN